ncbi:MAG: hypothetical protein GKR90_26290 [Pseudomonadales bacterium]|nr:hypothetical protein [Pseudomonadales bacterium]
MNILTDILSLFKRKKFVKEAKANDVLVLGLNEEPDMTGVASPIPYKSVRLIKVKDLVVKGEACDYTNVFNGAGTKPAYIYKDTTQDPCSVNLRSLAAVGNYISIVTNNNEIEISTSAEPNRASNVGDGVELYKDKTGAVLNFKTLEAGSGVSLSDSGDKIKITCTGGNAGVTSIIAGAGISVNSSTGDVTVTATTAPPTLYAAGLTQFNNNAPTLNVFANSISRILTATYVDVGVYQFDFSIPVNINRTAIKCSLTGQSQPFLFNVSNQTSNSFRIYSYIVDETGATVLKDGILFKTPLEIIVYPE